MTRRSLAALFVVAFGLACTEDPTAPGQCPDYCPPGNIVLIDTVLTSAVVRDSAFRGYLFPTEAALLIATNVPGVIENMDSTVISTSLPAIAEDLATDPIALKLALTTYLLALAVFIPISGWVADRFGARPTFMSAIGVFLLGSIGCAASNSLETMVAARFLQGMGGAMMVPVGRLVLLRTVPKNELVQALSWLTIPALIGPVVGPPLGGFITTYFDWRWIFLVNIPMGLLGIALAKRFIPDLREPTPPLATLCRSLMQHGRDPAYLSLEDDDGLSPDAMQSMMSRRYSFVRWGHSFRATELEAALGLGIIERTGDDSQRLCVAVMLRRAFESFREWIAVDAFDEWSSPLFYPIVARTKAACDGLSLAFEQAGIETRPLMPLVTQPIVRAYYEARGKSIDDYPVAKDLCERAFLVGCHPAMTTEHVTHIRDVTERYFVENHLMSRISVERPGFELWSQAWRAESCAEGQHAIASKELAAWQGGAPHPAFDAFRELLGRCEQVEFLLEIGCGAGYYQHVVPPYMAFTGVDVSEAMIRIANREYQPGAFLVAAAESLPFPDRSFDAVVLGSVIGCCDDWRAAIREAFRVSRRYVILHRVAAHSFAHQPDVRDTVKVAYEVKMAERIIRESVVLVACEELGGVRVGGSILWSKSEDGFQGSYLFEKR